MKYVFAIIAVLCMSCADADAPPIGDSAEAMIECIPCDVTVSLPGDICGPKGKGECQAVLSDQRDEGVLLVCVRNDLPWNCE